MTTAKYTVGRCPHCGAMLDQPPRKVSAKELRERARAEALREKFRAKPPRESDAPVEVDPEALARAEEIRRKFGLI